MKIIEKICKKQASLRANPAVTIALIGDSVTQGCFECYTDHEGNLQTLFDYESSYGNRLKGMLNTLYPNVPFNVINAGISGDNAQGGLKRLDRDVLSYRPDLVIVGFALNDSTTGKEGLPAYKEALAEIVKRVVGAGAECIVLTPNAMNTKISDFIKEPAYEKVAKNLLRIQTSGVLDLYAEAAREVAAENGATICDVYAKWKKMIAAGVNVTELLANKLNHPLREMHYLTAMMLCDCILG
ncbi:MAG: GDSL family lipase [Clostridia bacterium]|nr:GDSL family lipase [Clostridia bacterium]